MRKKWQKSPQRYDGIMRAPIRKPSHLWVRVWLHRVKCNDKQFAQYTELQKQKSETNKRTNVRPTTTTMTMNNRNIYVYWKEVEEKRKKTQQHREHWKRKRKQQTNAKKRKERRNHTDKCARFLGLGVKTPHSLLILILIPICTQLIRVLCAVCAHSSLG